MRGPFSYEHFDKITWCKIELQKQWFFCTVSTSVWVLLSFVPLNFTKLDLLKIWRKNVFWALTSLSTFLTSARKLGDKLNNKLILFVSYWGHRKMKIGPSPLLMPSTGFRQWGEENVMQWRWRMCDKVSSVKLEDWHKCQQGYKGRWTVLRLLQCHFWIKTHGYYLFVIPATSYLSCASLLWRCCWLIIERFM